MRIKNIRLKLGMTTEKFAQAFQEQPPSKGTISKWENGHYLPNNERLKRIAELGNTSVDELLYGDQKNIAFNVFKETEKEVLSNYPFLNNEKFNSFFEKIDEFREKVYLDIKKLGITDIGTIETFYKYSLGRGLPFNDSPTEFNIKANLLQEAGYSITLQQWSKESIEFLEIVSEEKANNELNSIVLNITNLIKIYEHDQDILKILSKLLATLVKYSEFDYMDLKISNKQSKEDIIQDLYKAIEKDYQITNELKTKQLDKLIKEI